MRLLEFEHPDRFVAGTVGPPGGRTFFLQAVQGRAVVSVSLEKEQVAVLAERVNDLLDEVDATADVPQAPQDNDPLSTPIDDEFRVSTMSLAWEADRKVVIIECHDREVSLEPDETGADLVEVTEPDASLMRVVLRPELAREFARRSLAAVASGRPPCPFCGEPLEPTGHVCPRANGYRR
ncbi:MULTISPECIES: DUF3090 domain-containing protein [Allobranchiibius]|uniref:Putative repeat protein (TIGR03847 family) n=1 Tax=Allobranchiibius huperziae TaxID=1874116 RepID=A0A853DAY5_9MICO|nr:MULTISPECIES: DUF3090 domain-containing protein [Allobranchiibius]MBO1754629.1 DUF3090 domain-containing protein [Allobranchiibius sp. CTAmp26]NYJ74696.1 putative repeat protein (TIGR03847 family) [Allobranchiibius huperziae]UIJ33928.1 DUF3090 domain-containing protein [Allobranchiibius sp. GilTou73]